MMDDDGRELDNPSSRHHVLIQGPSPDRLTTEAAAPTAAVRSHKHDSRNTGSPLRDSQIPLRHGSCSHSRCRGGRVASYLLLCPLRGTRHTSMPYYVSSRHEGETSSSWAGIRTLPPRRPWRISHDSSRHHHPDVRSGFSHSHVESAVVRAASTRQGSRTFPHRICNSPSMLRLRHAVVVLKCD